LTIIQQSKVSYFEMNIPHARSPPTLRYIRFKLKNLLSTEMTSSLLLAEDLDTHEQVVVKQPKAGCKQTLQELSILPTLSHPGIIKLHGVTNGAHGPAPVFPYGPRGDLYNQIMNGPLPESVVKEVMFQLLEAVSYLHRNSVWHRDLKPENIIVLSDDFSSVVIIDFGLSIRADTPLLCDEFRGTLEYSAPELIMGGEYTEKVDIWALAVTMFVCLMGYFPFDPSSDILELDILRCDFDELDVPDTVSEDARDLLRGMMANDPELRFSADAALNQPWFNDIQNRRTAVDQQNLQDKPQEGRLAGSNRSRAEWTL
jgi:serine/threonine-protein kinase Chk2